MANQNIPERLNAPLQDKHGPFYPLTTYDQIIMPDGVSRWDGKSSQSEGTVKSVANKQPVEDGNVELDASDIGALATDGSGTMKAPIKFGSGTTETSVGANNEALLMRKDVAGNEYTIYDEGHKPSPEDIGAMPASETIDADTLNGMTYEQLKEALMREAVYQ